MEELDLKELFQMFWDKKIQIIIIVIIAMIIGVIYTLNCVTPLYKSSTTLILGRISASEDTKTPVIEDEKQITQSEISINSSLVSTYSELIKSKTLIKEVKTNLNTNISETALRNSVSVSRVADTELIEITVTNINPYLASQIANEIANVFGDKIEEIYNISNVYIIDQATPSLTPYNVNHTKDVILFGAIGVILSAAYIVIYNLLDTTVKTSGDMEKITNIKNLIAIPYNNSSENTELITFENAKSVVSEAFRTLRTNVQFSSISDKKTKTYLVTSCFQSEGKSYIAANLAVTFAQAGKKVILIDSDMRRGRQAKVFNFPNECGLSNYISNIDPNGMEINYDITQFIKETGITNLNIITSGNVPPNPSELLVSPRVPALIKDLKAYYDVIIFDGAPVLPVTDSLILARLLDSTILVARYNKTKKDDLAKAKSDIENVGGKIIGTCLNAVSNKAGTNDLNYYYYYGETEEKTFKDSIKQKIRSLKTAINKMKKLPKINKKASKKIRIIDEVQVGKKPIIKDVKREKKDIVKTIIEDVGKINDLDSISEINEIPFDSDSLDRNLEETRILEEQRKAEEEARRLEEIRILEEQRKVEEEARRLEEIRIIEEQRKAEEEARRLEEIRILEEQRKAEEEARRLEEIRILEEQRKAEEEARRQEELRILEEQRKAEEEARRQEKLRILEEQRKAEEEARRQEKLRILEEQRKAEEEARRQEELRILEEQRKAEEEARRQEELRILEEQRKAEEEARRQEELRILEEQRKAEEEAKRQEELRIAEEQRKAEEEAKRQEELRIAEEKKKAEEDAKKLEELRILEEQRKAEEAKIKEEIRLQKIKEKQIRKELREQKIKDAIDGVRNRADYIKDRMEQKKEEKKIQKAEKKIKAMEEQAKLVKEKLQKAEEERNKMFGKRIMFEIDEDLDETTETELELISNKNEKTISDNIEQLKSFQISPYSEELTISNNKNKEEMDDLYPRIK